MRGLVVLLVAIGLALVAPQAAFAESVHVENPGHHEVESEVDIGFFAVVNGMHFSAIQCGNDWEVDVQEDGSFELFASDMFPHAGSAGFCDTMEACNGDPWPGQVEETTDGGFEAHLVFCLDNTGTGLSRVPLPLECDLFDTELHCSYVVASGVAVEGELTLHESLGLMHAEI